MAFQITGAVIVGVSLMAKPIPRDPEMLLKLQQLAYLNREETACLIGVSLGTLEAEIRSGRLEVLRPGGSGRRVVITKAARERWETANLKAWSSSNAA